jgi:hypothetical protein
MMVENRSMKRFGVQIPAMVSDCRNETQTDCIQMFTKDISSHGAFFLTPTKLELGTEIDISLMLPALLPMIPNEEQTTIQLKGKIVRTASDGIAVAFNGNFKFKPYAGATFG